jgi:hypothetical protein
LRSVTGQMQQVDVRLHAIQVTIQVETERHAGRTLHSAAPRVSRANGARAAARTGPPNPRRQPSENERLGAAPYTQAPSWFSSLAQLANGSGAAVQGGWQRRQRLPRASQSYGQAGALKPNLNLYLQPTA